MTEMTRQWDYHIQRQKERAEQEKKRAFLKGLTDAQLQRLEELMKADVKAHPALWKGANNG